MKVWVDQQQCTSSSLCEVMAPDMFVIAEDGLAYVKEDGRPLTAGGAAAAAAVPPELEDDVREAAAQCPGECIYIVEDA